VNNLDNLIPIIIFKKSNSKTSTNYFSGRNKNEMIEKKLASVRTKLKIE
jgi:hypothetical protein